MKPGELVRCMDASNHSEFVQEGKVYEVARTVHQSDDYIWINVDGKKFRLPRYIFEDEIGRAHV